MKLFLLPVWCICGFCMFPFSAQADLLRQFAQNSSAVERLFCTFTQEKRLDFLPRPLNSKGHLAFERDYAHSGTPALLWEYVSPTPSGLWYAKGQGWLWAGSKNALHRASGEENRVLNAMLRHILQWFTVTPQKLREQYDVTEDEKDVCLTFIPRQQSFFAQMRVCLREDLRSLHSLRFTELNGDSTALTFAMPEINGTPLAAFPDGTPLP